MIYVEDELIKLNGVVLPGLVKSIEVIETAKVDEQEVEGSATKPKQATGYEDAKVNIELIIDDTPSQTKYQRYATLRAIFRSPGQSVPQPIPIISEDTAAHGVEKVIFKKLSHKGENKRGQLTATLELWEYIPQTITAKSGSSSGSGKSGGGAASNLKADYKSYLSNERGKSPARDDADATAAMNKETTVETKELYYPQISAQAGSYTFEEGVELEIYSSKSSYYDWAKIRFTSQFRPKLSLKKKDPATIQLGYDGTLEDVFTGFVSGNYDGGTYANEVALKDEMLLMEETIINDTFLDTTPQELISYFLAQAGLSKMKLSSKTYPTRKMLPIRRQTAVQAINAVNAAWGLRVPFFFSGGVFYWDEKPEQKKVYTFERGVNILNLRRAGGVWELETVSAPFIKHSHKINLIHPQVSGEVEVSKVVSKTNDSGFIRTYIYF